MRISLAVVVVIVALISVASVMAHEEDAGLHAANESKAANSNVSVNITAMNEKCISQFNCKDAERGLFWFGCYYDGKTAKCRCFKDAGESCGITELLDLEAGVTGAAVAGKGFKMPFSLPAGSGWAYASAGVLAIAGIGAGLVFIRSRNTPSNNLRRAIKYHRLGEEANRKGHGDKAQHYYRLSSEYRKKYLGR